MIKVEHVSKTYKAKQGTVEAVKDVSLEISRGEIFGIIGFSGAGKSTLIRLLNGLESVTSGQISINGKDITKLKRKALLKERQKIAMIFQHFNLLWSRTVEENIAFSLEIAGVAKDARNRKVKELIEILSKEMDRQEIQDMLGLSHRENFRLKYLKPALEQGFIEMTIPERPSSKLQKYRLTILGKQFKDKL